MSDTPRTDKKAHYVFKVGEVVQSAFSKQLERELNAAKASHAADIAELNERLKKQHADMLDTIVGLRSELTRWQSLAGQMAEALGRCTTKSWFASDDTGEVIVALDAGKVRAALAAYESAKKGDHP